MVGLLSSVGLGTWETWMSDSLQGLGVDWFVEQVGVGQLGKLGCQILQGLRVGLLSSLGSGRRVLGSWMSDSSGSYGWFVTNYQLPITNYQMALSKQGAGGGSATHKEPT